MSIKKTKSVLLSYLQTGDTPTEQEFKEIIDSLYNWSVDDLTARDAIATADRDESLIVYVKNTTGDPQDPQPNWYYLKGGITNSDWELLVSSSATLHADLPDVQGGAAGELYHITAAEKAWIEAQRYTPPSISITPATKGSGLEVGDVLDVSAQVITISLANAANIYLNQIQVDANGSGTYATLALPQPNFSLTFNSFKSARGTYTIGAARIQRDDTQAYLTDTVTAFWEYRVFFFLYDEVANSNLITDPMSDSALTAEIIAQHAGVLRSNKAVGLTPFNPAGTLKNIYVAYPVSYGTAKIAPESFPTAYVNVDNKDFTYTNGSVDTNYRLTRMQDAFAGPANYIIS